MLIYVWAFLSNDYPKIMYINFFPANMKYDIEKGRVISRACIRVDNFDILQN